MWPASFDKSLCMASQAQLVTSALEYSIFPAKNEVISETPVLPLDAEPAASADVSPNNNTSIGNSQTPKEASLSPESATISLLQQLLETHRKSVSREGASLDGNAPAEIGNETPRLENLLQSMKESTDVAQPANAATNWADCPVDSPDSSEEESLDEQRLHASAEKDSDAMELLKQMMRVDISSTA